MLATPLLAVVLLAANADTHTLKWKLSAGDVFYNKTTVAMKQSMEVMGQSIDQKMTMTTVLRFKVKSVNAGSTVVEMTYLKNEIDAQGLPGVNPASNLKNVTFIATLNDKMEVTKLEGYEKFLEALGADNEELAPLMKAMLPETAIRQMFGQTFVLAPAKPVAVGDKWDRTTKVALGPLGTMTTKEQLKLDAVKGDLATIRVKGDLSFTPGEGNAGLPFKITKADLMAEKYEGTLTFNTALGRLAESKAVMNLNGTLTVSVAGQELEAKLSQESTTVSVISDKNPVVD
jgi:hypothetical protein